MSEHKTLRTVAAAREIKTVEWDDARTTLRLIDQTLLPLREESIACHTPQEVAAAVRDMKVRGAPAIGVTAAYGLALGALTSSATSADALVVEMDGLCELMAATRPTAVNLFWAIARVRDALHEMVAHTTDVNALRAHILAVAHSVYEEDLATNRAMAYNGADLIPDGGHILTHCNTGALATAGYYGTALGVIRAAWEQGKNLHVWVDETRPFLQGARLTTWELGRLGIPHTLITDNMAGHFMQRGKVDLVIVGADRITAVGDVANKIGTYSLAVLCAAHDLPFYCAAPRSTIDRSLTDWRKIPIEERSTAEVVMVRGQRIAPEATVAAHPAFDVTPAHYVKAIVTEAGVARPPFAQNISALFDMTL